MNLEKEVIDTHLEAEHDELWKSYRFTCNRYGFDNQKWGWLEDETIDLHNTYEFKEGLTPNRRSKAAAKQDDGEVTKPKDVSPTFEKTEKSAQGNSKKQRFYAVVNGQEGSKGKIYNSWKECSPHVLKFSGVVYYTNPSPAKKQWKITF